MPFGIAKEQALGFRSESLLLSNEEIIPLLLPSQFYHMFPLDDEAVFQHAVPVVVLQELVNVSIMRGFLDKLVNTAGSSELYFRPLAPKLEVRLSIVWKNIADFQK